MKVKFRKRIIDVDITRSIGCFISAFCIVFMMVMSIYLRKNIEIAMASTIETETHVNETSSETEISPSTTNQNKEVNQTVTTPIIIEPFNEDNVTIISNSVVTILPTQSKVITSQRNKNIQESESGKKEVALESPSKIENKNRDEVKTEEQPKKEEYYIGYNIPDDQKEILCRIVEAEVTGYGNAYKISDEEMKNCKFRVARVVLNRIKSQRFKGKTVESIVFAKNQFSPLIDGRFYRVTITDLTREAVDMALDASISDNIPGGTFFTSGNGFNNSELELIYTDAVGHKFYRYKNWETDSLHK